MRGEVIMCATNIKYIDGMPFKAITYPFNKPDSMVIENIKLEQSVNYINSKKINKAYIKGVYNYNFLKGCKGIKHLSIEFQLSMADYSVLEKKGKYYWVDYDLSSIYDLNELKSLQFINNENPDIRAKAQLDVSELSTLEMYKGEYSFVKNIEKAERMRMLELYKYDGIDLNDFGKLKNLITLQVVSSKLQSLNGCEMFDNMQCIYLHYNRNISNISSLGKIKHSLKALRIENCPKIEDFSVLNELENLELLELSGSNSLPNLQFLKKMKHLKTFTFNMNVEDGDLSLCKDLTYVYCEKNRKHYNLKDKEFPKEQYFRGNENIEEWLRLE